MVVSRYHELFARSSGIYYEIPILLKRRGNVRLTVERTLRLPVEPLLRMHITVSLSVFDDAYSKTNRVSRENLWSSLISPSFRRRKEC